MRSSSKVALAVASVIGVGVAVPTVENETVLGDICDSIHDLQCFGDDLWDHGKVQTHDECCQACQQTRGCRAWTWNYNGDKHCWLKWQCSHKNHLKGYHSGIASSPSPPSPPPSPPSPPSPSPGPQCWNQDVKAGNCDKPNVCADSAHVGKWSVYVVPCDDSRVNDLYNIDPGWGGAHITMTSFQAESEDSAEKKFKKLQDDLHSKGDWWKWKPQTFSADTKSSGVVRLGIKSANLDHMVGSLGNAGWNDPTKKGNWHVTLADMTNQKFSEHDQKYKDLTHWFENMPQHWAVVLVQCYKGANGEIRFQRQKGYMVHEWTNSEISV